MSKNPSPPKQRVVHYEHNPMTHERMLDAGEAHGLPRKAATVAEFNNKRFLKIHYSQEVQQYLMTSGIATTWGFIEELVLKELRRRGYGNSA